MAKTKWIVPAIALVICAASLVGAAYAAYTATLTDTESVTTTNNYVTLDLGVTPSGGSVAIDYAENATYVSGAFKAITYSPQTTTSPILLLSFTVDDKEVGGSATTTGCSLAINNVTAKNGGGNAANFTISNANLIVKVSSSGEVVASLSSLSYDTQYDLYLSYTHNDADILKYKIDGYELDGATVVADATAAANRVPEDMVATVSFDLVITAIVA